jgi:hypothetical protein
MKMLNKIIGSGIAIAAVLAFCASTTHAQNLLVNGDFENGFNGDGNATLLDSNPLGLGPPTPGQALNPGTPSPYGSYTENTPIGLTTAVGGALNGVPVGSSGVNQGWGLFNGGGTSGPNDMFASPNYPPESGSVALLESVGVGNNWNPPGAYQIVTGIIPGDTYKFGIWALTDTANDAYALTAGLLVQLGFETAGLVGPSTVENPGGNVSADFALPTRGTWAYYTVTATAPAGDTDAIVYAMFQDNNGATGTENVYYDNASLTLVPVPEPSSLALLSMGLAIPFYFIRRRKS